MKPFDCGDPLDGIIKHYATELLNDDSLLDHVMKAHQTKKQIRTGKYSMKNFVVVVIKEMPTAFFTLT